MIRPSHTTSRQATVKARVCDLTLCCKAPRIVIKLESQNFSHGRIARTFSRDASTTRTGSCPSYIRSHQKSCRSSFRALNASTTPLQLYPRQRQVQRFSPYSSMQACENNPTPHLYCAESHLWCSSSETAKMVSPRPRSRTEVSLKANGAVSIVRKEHWKIIGTRDTHSPP